MKTLNLQLIWSCLSFLSAWSAWAAECPKPAARVAAAFRLVEDPSAGNLAEYLRRNLVASSALNERCETLYLASIRARNDAAREYLSSIGYAQGVCEVSMDEKAESVDQYLDQGYRKFSFPDTLPVTPYTYAVQYGTPAAVKALARQFDGVFGDCHKILDPQRNLVWAAARNRPDTIQVFLDQGADVNAGGTDDWSHRSRWKPLMMAVQTNTAEVVRYLVEKGAKIDAGAFRDQELLSLAIAAANLPVVEYLHSIAGGFANFSLKPYLQDAFRAGNLASLQWLVNHGVTVNDASPPLIYQVGYEAKPEIYRWILKQQPRLDPVAGRQPILMSAVMANAPVEFIRGLVALGADSQVVIHYYGFHGRAIDYVLHEQLIPYSRYTAAERAELAQILK